MISESSLELLQRFFFLWYENESAYADWAKRRGISLHTLVVLYALYEQGGDPCTQKKICSKWPLPKQTVNCVLKDLQRDGYLTLVPMIADRRNKEILLTDTGAEFMESIISELHEIELLVVEQLGEERMTNMADTLAQYNDLFRSICERRETNG